AALLESHHDAARLRGRNASATLVFISPFGQTGPLANAPASDLTLFFASGISGLLTGQVDDLSEAPIRPVGEQSEFLGGLAAACAGMHAVQAAEPGAVVDVSLQEVLATMGMTELARAGLTGKSRSRKRLTDGNGATVCILPARDGYVAISPRENEQWAAWLVAMGSPDWGSDPRFVTKADRVANWDALHALMSEWSRQHDKQWIADTAQAAHVPSFPLCELAEQFESAQLRHRNFFRTMEIDGRAVMTPGSAFGLTIAQGVRTRDERAGPLPLAGVRVLDFSWVIAGPTTTRTLAAMGADVIKIEAPGRGDPGRASELHTVLGQAKRAIVLDLKSRAAVEIALALVAKADVLVENFATGVMDRLGLGADALRAVNPNLIYVSASGAGRTGPESSGVAYGTLLQSFTGFTGLNRHPDLPPRVGIAWLDPMCGLMLAFGIAAAIWQRRRGGGVARIDFSMIEAMLWTMAEPMLAAQSDSPPKPQGNRSDRHAPHGVWACAGIDEWVSVVVRDDEDWRRLCDLVPALVSLVDLGFDARVEARHVIDHALANWLAPKAVREAEHRLLQAGIPAAALATSLDLVKSEHLAQRGFWDAFETGVVPGLPWRASFGRAFGPAPGLGGDTDAVLAEVLGLAPDAIAKLRAGGALG
ncbi:MAG: CoA transferase, partial [Pseudomonadota bacterium]